LSSLLDHSSLWLVWTITTDPTLIFFHSQTLSSYALHSWQWHSQQLLSQPPTFHTVLWLQ
jgi:hypothetical protein